MDVNVFHQVMNIIEGVVSKTKAKVGFYPACLFTKKVLVT